MDGRRFRRWCLCGGLAVAAVGCDRNTYPNAFTMPKAGDPAAARPAGGGMAGKPAVWGGGPAPAANAPAGLPGMPGDAAATKPRKPGQGFAPDTLVTFGDTWVDQAFADPAPPSRDQLIDQARTAYQKALQKDPKNKGALLGTARLYAKLGERERADEAYKKYLNLYPKDADAMHEVAAAHARWSDFPGATAWCEKALQLDPENRTYRKTLGFCQAYSGKWNEGLATLRQVMPEAQARYNMGRVMGHLNFPDQGREQLLAAVQLDPSFAPAQELLAEIDQSAPPAAGVPSAAPNPVRQVSGTNP